MNNLMYGCIILCTSIIIIGIYYYIDTKENKKINDTKYIKYFIACIILLSIIFCLFNYNKFFNKQNIINSNNEVNPKIPDF